MSKKLSDFKALLFDVDQTLTNSQRDVTPATQKALHKLAEKGIHIAVCTGRHHSMLQYHALTFFSKESIHITCGGAQIVQTDGTVLWEKTLPPDICEEIQQKATAQNMGTNQPAGAWYYANEALLKRYIHQEHLTKALKPIAEIPHWNSPVLVITEVTEEFKKYLDTIPEICYKSGTTSLDTPYADVTPTGVNKALGIMEWSKITGIDPSEIMGFGDAENDLEFLQLVGWAVAMGNASDEVKAQANRVIGHTDDDGLAVYLEQILAGADV
jgi:Cof subfamily protein (haloacid dehalogenase superfamily)